MPDTIQTKVARLLAVSGKPKQRLASEIGVNVQTLNRWLSGKPCRYGSQIKLEDYAHGLSGGLMAPQEQVAKPTLEARVASLEAKVDQILRATVPEAQSQPTSKPGTILHEPITLPTADDKKRPMRR